RVRNRIKWDNVKYQKGYIEAIARNNGKIVARHKIETTGDATKLIATGDNQTWKADGMDLQHVRISAVDRKGRRVYGANNLLTFNVEGPAEIVGVINGDITSHELTVGNNRSLFNGTATVILRSTREAGQVTLTTTTDGLKKNKLVFNTVK
ncbi:MAG: beta-galactosidase, partial [Prevotella sp.]|nr:beta-galactosidase [Prevotella sp.]